MNVAAEVVLLVHPPSGPCMSITLPHHSTVADVMTAVHDAHGLSPVAQVVTFGGKPIIADTPLLSLSLAHGCMLRVNSRLIGGGNSASSPAAAARSTPSTGTLPVGTVNPMANAGTVATVLPAGGPTVSPPSGPAEIVTLPDSVRLLLAMLCIMIVFFVQPWPAVITGYLSFGPMV